MCVLLQVYIKAITIFHTQISLLLSTALLLFMVLTIEFYGHQLIVTVSNVIFMPCFFLFRDFTQGIRVSISEMGMEKISNFYGCSFVHFKFNF